MMIAATVAAGTYTLGTLLEAGSLKKYGPFEKSFLGTAGRVMQFAPAFMWIHLQGPALLLAYVPILEHSQNTLPSRVERYIDIASKTVNLSLGLLLIFIITAVSAPILGNPLSVVIGASLGTINIVALSYSFQARHAGQAQLLSFIEDFDLVSGFRERRDREQVAEGRVIPFSGVGRTLA